MRSNRNVVCFACLDGLVHDHRVAGMATTSDIGIVYERNEFIVRTSFEVAVTFAEVDVDLDFGGNGRHCGRCEVCSECRKTDSDKFKFDDYSQIVSVQRRASSNY